MRLRFGGIKKFKFGKTLNGRIFNLLIFLLSSSVLQYIVQAKYEDLNSF